MGTFNGPIYHIFVVMHLKLNEKKNTLSSHISKSILHLGEKKGRKIKQNRKRWKLRREKPGQRDSNPLILEISSYVLCLSRASTMP